MKTYTVADIKKLIARDACCDEIDIVPATLLATHLKDNNSLYHIKEIEPNERLVRLIKARRKVAAVKYYRDLQMKNFQCISLKEAREAVEKLAEDLGVGF